MDHPALPWRLLADAVLLVHLGVVLFVVGGLVLVVAGNRRAPVWGWVNGWPFRLAHAAAIGTVVAHAWLGMVCPLTTLEMWLRRQAGQATHGQGFIEHWVQLVLYHDLPGWMFTAAYTGFGLLVAAVWLRWPPRRAGRGASGPG